MLAILPDRVLRPQSGLDHHAALRSFRSPALENDVRYISLGAFLKATNFIQGSAPSPTISTPRTSLDDEDSIDLNSLSTIQLCYASCSNGRGAEITLPKKIAAVEAAGFQAIELCMPDLVAFASEYLGKPVGTYDWDDLCTVAAVIKDMCDSMSLCILMLQSFTNFEGWPEEGEEREDAFNRARGWIRVMKAAGTDTLQVNSSDAPIEKIGTDRSRFIKDLQELADILAEDKFRLAYENCCWSTHAPKWSDAWDIVNKVDRPNIGLCLDTFQIAGSECADPTTESGLVETIAIEKLESSFKDSLFTLSRTVPKEKIFVLQISDANCPDEPFAQDDDENVLEPRKRLNELRILPFSGGYLPVIETTKAVLRTGYRGWFSYEFFNIGLEDKDEVSDEVTLTDAAAKCQRNLLVKCSEDP